MPGIVEFPRGVEERGGGANPTVVHCVALSKTKMDQVMRSIEPDEWATANRAFMRVPAPYRSGLYPVSR